MKTKILMFVTVCMMCMSCSSVDQGKISCWRSESAIREKLLKLTPIGMKKPQVIQDISTKLGVNEKDIHVNPYSGVAVRNKRPGTGITGIKGRSEVYVQLGEYSVLFLPVAVGVYAKWAFDEEDRLIDVFVEKETDCP